MPSFRMDALAITANDATGYHTEYYCSWQSILRALNSAHTQFETDLGNTRSLQQKRPDVLEILAFCHILVMWCRK